MGLGEGAALPVMNNLVATNIPPERRATALGSCFSGFHSGEHKHLDLIDSFLFGNGPDTCCSHDKQISSFI